jgi:hypothetical protein
VHQKACAELAEVVTGGHCASLELALTSSKVPLLLSQLSWITAPLTSTGWFDGQKLT